AVVRESILYVALICLLVVAILVGALTALVTFVVKRPLGKVMKTAEAVAGGELDVSVDVTSNDEIGSLATSFNAMIQNLRRLVDDVQAKSDAAQLATQEALASKVEVEEQEHYLSQSVERMLEAMQRFASGDLTVQLAGDRQDEIGRLFSGFTAAVARMRHMMEQINISLETVSSTSVEIGAASEQLASSTQEQSAQMAEVAAATEEMVRTIVDNTRTASEASDAVTTSGETADQGVVIVGETLEKINRIAEVVQTAANTVQKLGDSSQEIGDIVQVINDIADQTNLLALNAAIEAARAGDQGRGFAVVADEVRKLAERTTAATREIAGMIHGIQTETGEAVSSMQVGNKEMKEGIELAGRAGRVLQDIRSSAKTTVDMVTQIAAASVEQSSTSEQISRSIEMISTASNDSALGINQIAESVDGLNRLTHDLGGLVKQFQLQEVDGKGLVRSSPSVGDGMDVAPLLS
ncbi:MAG: methyl-accepting chemotaxis protein, partial [Bacteroidota bacterium]